VARDFASAADRRDYAAVCGMLTLTARRRAEESGTCEQGVRRLFRGREVRYVAAVGNMQLGVGLESSGRTYALDLGGHPLEIDVVRVPELAVDPFAVH
jgi:hypothetical protein